MKRLWISIVIFSLLLLGAWGAQLAAYSLTDTSAQAANIATPPPMLAPGPTSTSAGTDASLRLLAPQHDTFVTSDAPDENFGATTELRTQWLAEGEEESIALIWFDTSDMLVQTEVMTGYLSLVLTGYDGADLPSITVSDVMAPWQEVEVTWQTRPAISADPVASTQVPGAPDRAFYWDITPLVRRWIQDPASNHGLALRVHQADGGALRIFGSRESNVAPRLTLAYTVPPIQRPTPTPTPLPPHEEVTLPISDTAYLRWERTENQFYVWPDPGNIPLSVDNKQLIQERRLLSFDLSAIPPNAEVYQAQLTLYLEGGTNETPVFINANMMERLWNGQKATWANAVWAANKESDAPRGSARVPLNGPGWISMDVTRAVQRWVSGRSRNYGFQLLGPDGVDEPWSRVFSGNNEQNFAPYLLVRYGVHAASSEEEERERRNAGLSSSLPAPVRPDLCPLGGSQLIAPDRPPGVPRRREWARIQAMAMISGTVTDSYVSYEEWPPTHDDHDFCFKVKKNNANAWAMGGANSDGMEIEWEHQVWPMWAWPTNGDQAIIFGPLIYDCGHDVSAGGRSEIHPPRGLVTIRKNVAADVSGYGGLGTVLVNKADIYFSSRRTRAYCGGWCEPPFVWPPFVPLGSQNYEFDIYPPNNRAAGAKLIWKRVDHSDSFGTAVAPTIVKVGSEASQHLHVKLPFKGKTGRLHTASTIYVGWSRTKDPDLRTFKVQVHGINITDNADPISDGEWYVWVGINGQWFNLRDYINGLGDAKNQYYGTNSKDLVAYVTLPNTENAHVRIRTTGFESDCIDDRYGIANDIPKLSPDEVGNAFINLPGSIFKAACYGDENDEIQAFDLVFEKKDNFGGGIASKIYPATGGQNGQYGLKVSIQELDAPFQYRWIEAGVADPGLKVGGITLDGSCAYDEYSASRVISFTLNNTSQDHVTVKAAFDDDALYVCMHGIPAAAFDSETQQAVIYLDPTVPSLPKIYPGWIGHSDDLRIAFQTKPSPQTTAFSFAPNIGWYNTPVAAGLVSAKTTLTSPFERSVEFRIDKSLIGRGPWSSIAEKSLMNRGIGAMFAIERPASFARRGAWPFSALGGKPEEWARMVFLPACPVSLNATRIGNILDMTDPRRQGTIKIGGGEVKISKVGDQAKVVLDYAVLFDHPRCNLKNGTLAAAWPSGLKAVQWMPGGTHQDGAITWTLPPTARKGHYAVTVQQLQACWGGENPPPTMDASGKLDTYFNSTFAPRLTKSAAVPICKAHGVFGPELKMWGTDYPKGVLLPWIYLYDPMRWGDPAMVGFKIHNESDVARRVLVKTMMVPGGVSVDDAAANPALDFTATAGDWYTVPAHGTIAVQQRVMASVAAMSGASDVSASAVAVEVGQPDGGGPPQVSVRQVVPYLKLTPGQESVFATTVWRNTRGPSALHLEAVVDCPGWQARVTPDSLPADAPGQPANVQVHIRPLAGVTLGSGCPVDIIAYSDTGEFAGSQRVLDLPPVQFSADAHPFAATELQLDPRHPEDGQATRLCTTIYNRAEENLTA